MEVGGSSHGEYKKLKKFMFMLGGCKKVSQVSGEGRDSGGGEGEEFRGEGE